MDSVAIYRREAEIGLLLLQNRPPFSGVTIPFALNPVRGLASQVAEDNNILKKRFLLLEPVF